MPPPTSRPLQLFQFALAASLLLSALLSVVWTIHWPLVGDAALIHYIVFLIRHGMAPYRVLGDMNMPGSFLVESAAMHLFGGGALGWRLFDLTLLTLAACAFFVITGPGNRLAGLFAAGLFALVHARDGLAEGGQRDLTMAVAVVGATACLLLALRARAFWPAALFGLLSGLALTIKPTALPLSLAQLAVALWTLHRRGQPWRTPLVVALSAMTLLPLLALAFLLQQHAVTAFLAGLRTIVPYYASLGHRPLGYLLLHSLSPLLALVLLWLAALAVARPPLTPKRTLLFCGAFFGLISYVVQARGLPYYRYPLLAFLLPLMALDLTRLAAALPRTTLRTRTTTAVAVLALAVGGFWIAPQSAFLLHRYRWQETDFLSSLEQDLTRLGGPELSGHIQCIDSISGCGATLYRMRLVQSTGVLSDFLLFGPSTVPIVQTTRAELVTTLNEAPPKVIVISSWLHLNGPGGFRKLDRWPAFEQFLAEHYRLDTAWSPTHPMRWWSREELSASYRIYVLR